MPFEHHTAPLLPFRQFLWRVIRHTGMAGVLVGGSLAIGMAGYMGLAHMRWIDAFLNSCMLLGGMGPVGDLPNDSSKFFAGVYALYAGLVFIASTGIIVTPIAHRVLHRLHQRSQAMHGHDTA